jgi:hypothetical protein
VSVSGSPKFDITRLLKPRLPRTDGENEIRVCINTRFGSINRHALQESILSGKLPLDAAASNKRNDDFQENERRIFLEFICLIKALGGMDDFKVLVRPHPTENSLIYKSISEDFDNVFVDNQRPLFQSIYDSDIIIHDSCTTALEAKSAGKFVYTLRPQGLDNHYDTLANTISDESFESASDAVQCLKDSSRRRVGYALRQDARMQHFIANWSGDFFYQKFFDILKTSSRDSAIMERLLEASIHSYYPMIYKNKKEVKSGKKFPQVLLIKEIKDRLALICHLLDVGVEKEDTVLKSVSRKSILLTSHINSKKAAQV